jgi:hypothetical protein
MSTHEVYEAYITTTRVEDEYIGMPAESEEKAREKILKEATRTVPGDDPYITEIEVFDR